MQVVKKTGAKLLIRTVQPEVVEQWSSRIHSLERDIQRVNLVRSYPPCDRGSIPKLHGDALTSHAQGGSVPMSSAFFTSICAMLYSGPLTSVVLLLLMLVVACEPNLVLHLVLRTDM